MSDVISRSWFVVFCNPEEHGYLGTPEEIIEKLKNEWIENHPLRKGDVYKRQVQASRL